MPTAHQLQLVDNIERSVKSLHVQSKGPPSISAIMVDAGYDAAGLFAVVTRLKEAGEHELVSRLRSAFEYAKKMPLCLESVKPAVNGLKLEMNDSPPPLVLEPQTVVSVDEEGTVQEIPVAPPEEKKKERPAYVMPSRPSTQAQPEDEETSALAQILSILRPLRHQGRTRILGATSMFYGVGE